MTSLAYVVCVFGICAVALAAADSPSIDEILRQASEAARHHIISTSANVLAGSSEYHNSDAMMSGTAGEVLSKLHVNINKKCSVIGELDIRFSCDEWETLQKSYDPHHRSSRSAVRRQTQLWEGSTVYYSYHAYGRFSHSDKSVIRSAMDEWQKYTCIVFQEVEEHDGSVDKIMFIDGCLFGAENCGCWSHVGRMEGEEIQALSLSYGCRNKKVAVHELGHAMGLWHEHNRPDRDEYISIVKENIADQSIMSNFQKLPPSDVLEVGLPYDYTSVMHYGQYAFANRSEANEPSIVTSDPVYQDVIGTSEGLSVGDISTVNVMYRCRLCTGSYIHLQANPPSIKPLLTQHVTLTCQLNSSTPATAVLNQVHGDDDEDDDAPEDLPREDCNVTSTSKEIEFISSIVLSKDTGEEVAAVTEHDQPRLTSKRKAGGARGAVVSGNVTGYGDVKGYLEVTWDTPTEAESGNYICEVNSVAKGGHGVSFKTPLTVSVVEPSVSDLVAKLSTVRRKVGQQERHITALTRTVANQETQIGSLTTMVQSQGNNISIFEKKVDAQEIKTSSIRSDVTRALHVEKGYLRCGPKNGWGDGRVELNGRTFEISRSVRHDFKTPYAAPPVVYLSMSHFHKAQEKHEYFGIGLKSVTTTGFEIACGSSPHAAYTIIDLDVDWLSLAV